MQEVYSEPSERSPDTQEISRDARHDVRLWEIQAQPFIFSNPRKHLVYAAHFKLSKRSIGSCQLP